MIGTRYGVISWNGERSDQYGISIEKYPNYNKPQRKIDRYTVPGRNGEIIMPQNAWEMVEQKYDIVAGNGAKHSVPGGYSRVAAWLNSASGYAELWDDFDPDHYRIAFYEGPIDIDSLSVGRVARSTISFICKPQRFLMSGKTPVDILSTPASIINPTVYESKPLINVKMATAGSGVITINDLQYTITDIPVTGIYIDSEEMHCYGVNGENMNSKVSSNTGDFAVLVPGSNTIGLTGDIQSLSIVPHWFEI